MVLDAFFAVAEPVTVGGLVLGKVLLALNSKEPFYEGPDGEARRDEVNRRHRTSRGAVIIGLLFIPIYALVVLGLIEEWGSRAFTYVIAALLLIPMLTVYSVVTMVYMYAVHGAAAMKRH